MFEELKEPQCFKSHLIFLSKPPMNQACDMHMRLISILVESQVFRNYVDNANGKTHFMLGYVCLPSEWFCLHNWKSEAADFHPPSEILHGLDIYWVDKGHKRTQPTSQNNVECERKYQNKKLVWSHRPPPRSLWQGAEKLSPLYFIPSSSLQSSQWLQQTLLKLTTI